MLAGDHEQAIGVAQDALEIAEALELDELRAHALTTIGSAKFHIELSTGRPELEQALEIALAADSPIAAVTLNNLAVLAIWEGDFRRGYEVYPESSADRRALRRPGLSALHARERGVWGLRHRTLGRGSRSGRSLHRRVRDVAALSGGARPRRQGL